MRLLIADFRLWIEKQGHGEGQKLIGYTDKLLAAFPQPAAMPQSAVSIHSALQTSQHRND